MNKRKFIFLADELFERVFQHADYIFATDEEEHWHQMLANWCEQGNIRLIWEDAQSNSVEQVRRVYARKHFIEHLYFAQNWERLFAILDAHHFGQMKVRYDPSTRSYSEDLDLGRRATAWAQWTFEEGISLLPHLWRYTLLRCSLTSRANRYPEAAFQVLMLLGREQEAFGLAELLTNRVTKAQILLAMASVQDYQQQEVGSLKKKELFIDLLRRSCEVAGTIEDSDSRDEVLSELRVVLIQAHEWAETKLMIGMIEDILSRASALRELGVALAQAQEWAEAERVIGTIEDSYDRVRALIRLGEALAQAQEIERAQTVWAKAERMISTIENSDSRASALIILGEALAQAQERAEAERVIGTIEDSYDRAKALRGLGTALISSNEHVQLLRLIKHFWQQVDTRDNAIALLSLANGLVPLKPEIGIQLFESFSWVDNFLKG